MNEGTMKDFTQPEIPLVPVPEYFEPDRVSAGWMKGSNGVGVQGGRWTTLANYQVLAGQYVELQQRVRELELEITRQYQTIHPEEERGGL